MSKVIGGVYDARANVIRLEEAPEDVMDGEKFTLYMKARDGEIPIIYAFRGIMKGKNGEDFAARIEEMFPVEK